MRRLKYVFGSVVEDISRKEKFSANLFSDRRDVTLNFLKLTKNNEKSTYFNP